MVLPVVGNQKSLKRLFILVLWFIFSWHYHGVSTGNMLVMISAMNITSSSVSRQSSPKQEIIYNIVLHLASIVQ